jgi:hypothetical protein
MWFFREIFRLIWTIAVAVAFAAALAGIWALLGPSDGEQIVGGVGGGTPAHAGFVHDFRVTCFIFGALLILLSAGGNRSTASARRVNWGVISAFSRGFGRLSPPVKHRPGDPTVTATAVFIGGAIVLIALGAVL